MEFIVIGITDNPEPYFPPEVLETIKNGKVFSGGKRHHEIVAPLLPADAKWIDITVPLDAVFEQYKLQSFNSSIFQSLMPIIVFASGDPLFFGFANTIRRRFPDARVTVYPSFNSLQLLAHRLLMPYHDMRIVSLTGRPWPEFDRALIEHADKIGVLTDREHTPATIARRMIDYGFTDYTMHVGEHLGNPSLERVTPLSPKGAIKQTFSHPNCLILTRINKDTALSSENNKAAFICVDPRPRVFGIPDSEFALLDGREKMITKMPIRLLTLQALDLPQKHVLWDIGFCTGSVSIEARLQFPHLHVVAFEIRPECEALISENAQRHGTPGIEVHIGDFCSICCDTITTPPDAIFIGGHGGQLKKIMAKALRYLVPGGCIVFNSVTSPKVPTNSRQLWDEACYDLNLVQASPLRIQLNDYNPIEILKAIKPL